MGPNLADFSVGRQSQTCSSVPGFIASHPTLGRCLVWDQPLLNVLWPGDELLSPDPERAIEAGSSEPDPGACFPGSGLFSD